MSQSAVRRSVRLPSRPRTDPPAAADAPRLPLGFPDPGALADPPSLADPGQIQDPGSLGDPPPISDPGR